MNSQTNNKIILRESLSSSEEINIGDNEELVYIFFTDSEKGSEYFLEFVLTGINSSVKIFGFNIDSKGITSTNIKVIHQNKNTTGYSWIKSVLGGDAKSSIKGMVKIEKTAINANGYFTHNSLLISNLSQVVSTPSLEIETNDVKASHASTTGHLDNDILFYLKCRGIEEQEAKRLVATSFAFEYVAKISDDNLQERIIGILNDRIEKII